MYHLPFFVLRKMCTCSIDEYLVFKIIHKSGDSAAFSVNFSETTGAVALWRSPEEGREAELNSLTERDTSTVL